MKKSKPGSNDETYFDSLKRKLLNQKIIVFVIIFSIIVSGIAMFIGHVEQIGKFFLGDKKQISETDKSKNQDSNQLKTGDSLHIDTEKKKVDSIRFDTLSAPPIPEKPKENNLELKVASIKIQDSIAWSETVFGEEEKNKIIQILKQNPHDFPMYKKYDAKYLEQCDQIFELRRYKEYINPCFDITLINKGQSPLILSKIGFEIVKAYYTTFSLGSFESMKVNVMGRYAVEFPSPQKVEVYGDTIDLEKNNLIITNEANRMYITRRNFDDTTPVKTITGKLIDFNEIWGTLHFSYADLPKTVIGNLKDPIYIDKNQVFRFLLQITNSKYIPTETLIKFVFKTDKGIKLSKPIYLLKP